MKKKPDVPVKTYNQQLAEHANNPDLPDFFRAFCARILRSRKADESRRREREANANTLKSEEGMS